MPRYVQVIPVLTTPLGLDALDYVIPDGLVIGVGDLVRVPFRRGSTYALVSTLLTQSRFASQAKAVEEVLCPQFVDPRFFAFLSACARHTFCSPPTILKSFFHALPKRLKPFPSIRQAAPQPTTPQTIWTPFLRQELWRLLEASRASAERTLVLVPWKRWLPDIVDSFPDAMLYTSDQADGERFEALRRFICGDTQTLVTTRLGAWLAMAADRVIVLEPENDDYKQDEQSPRLDTRWVVKRAWQERGFALTSIATTPMLGKGGEAVTIPLDLHLHFLQPGDRPLIPCVQSDSLRLLIEHEGPRVILHPVKHFSARIACWECHWQAECERCHQTVRHLTTTEAECIICHHRQAIPLQCPSCGGMKLHKSVPGLEKLKQSWAKHYADEAVEWRDMSNESAFAPLPTGAMVLVTLPELLSGHGEDLRRMERLCIQFRRMAALCASSKASLILQVAEETANQWAAWLSAEGFIQWQTKELADRQVFGYPPSKRLVKLLYRGSLEAASAWTAKLPASIRQVAEVRGPFPVDMKTLKRQERAAIHLLFPPTTKEAELSSLLTPLAAHVIIDLDPIAFYR